MRWMVFLCGLVAAAWLPLESRAQAAPDMASCLRDLRLEIPRQPAVRLEAFDRYTRDVEDLRPLIEQATATQPEFRLAIWDYVARLADAQREVDGRAILERESTALSAIWQKHGVDPATVVAVFGVETDYGRVDGRYPVVAATLSRACLNLASRERKAHFFAALWLLQEGRVRSDDFKGSWAGAFGLTQFMPGTFLQYMEDGDGSGDIDIIRSVPDALATTARYLRGLGWIDGLPWGVEVQVPPDVAAQWNALERDHGCLKAAAPSGLCRRWDQWAAAGLRRVDGEALLTTTAASGHLLPPETSAALLMPAGAAGPAWLVTRNFQAIWQYNRADAYALAIGLLADGLRGAAPMQAAWPTDDAPLSRAEFTDLQTLLIQRGHCDVLADGRDGPRTRSAVAAEEAAQGVPSTGRAGGKLLQTLRLWRQTATDLPSPCGLSDPQ